MVCKLRVVQLGKGTRVIVADGTGGVHLMTIGQLGMSESNMCDNLPATNQRINTVYKLIGDCSLQVPIA